MDRSKQFDIIRALLNDHRRIACWDDVSTDDDEPTRRYSQIDMYAAARGCIITHRVYKGKSLESWEVYVPISNSALEEDTEKALREYLKSF